MKVFEKLNEKILMFFVKMENDAFIKEQNKKNVEHSIISHNQTINVSLPKSAILDMTVGEEHYHFENGGFTKS